MHGTVVIWAAAIAVGLPGACRSSQEQSPVDAYLAFAQSAQRGEIAVAYAALSQSTQTLLEDRAKQIAEASGGALKAEAAALAFGVSRPASVSQVKLLSEDGAVAILSVTDEDRAHELKLTKEQSNWKIDLTDQLKK